VLKQNLPEILQTERVDLKKVSVEWLEEIFAENKGSVERYFHKFEVLGDLQTWINENRRQFERGEKMEMVVLDKGTSEFLGMVSLQRINIAPELGIWIKESAQGKGYAKEALSCLMNWYKMHEGAAEKLNYLVETGNFASINLARKLEMDYVGPVTNTDGVLFEQFTI
jgi:ribosomal-protein-alanine N-acetyltransferase